MTLFLKAVFYHGFDIFFIDYNFLILPNLSGIESAAGVGLSGIEPASGEDKSGVDV